MLDAPRSEGFPKGLIFGGLRLGKRYVSYYLMPVYAFRDLLEQASPELRRRMQRKSCFNFTALDGALFAELEILTAAGLERYRAEGLA